MKKERAPELAYEGGDRHAFSELFFCSRFPEGEATSAVNG